MSETRRASADSATTPASGRPLPAAWRRAVAVGLIVSLGLGAAAPALADNDVDEYINDYLVYSPYVVPGQSEVELRAALYHDSSLVLDHLNGQTISVAHGFTDWWKAEVYLGEYTRLPRQPNTLRAYEFENTFQLAPNGEFWADPGFLVAYEFTTHLGQPNALEFGPLFAKRNGRYLQRLNLLWEKQIGTGAARGYEFRAAYSLSYQVQPWFAPGLEAYAHPDVHTYQLGPVVNGELAQHSGNELEYSAGVALGVNPRAPNMTFMLRLEYEFY